MVLRGTTSVRVVRALLAQGFDHGVDVGGGDFHVRQAEFHAFVALQGDRGVHLEVGGEAQVFARAERKRLDLRLANRLQAFLTEAFRQGLTDELVHDFIANLATVLAADDIQRRLAGAEALDLGGATDRLEPQRERLLDPLGGHCHFHTATEDTHHLHRHTHG